MLAATGARLDSVEVGPAATENDIHLDGVSTSYAHIHSSTGEKALPDGRKGLSPHRGPVMVDKLPIFFVAKTEPGPRCKKHLTNLRFNGKTIVMGNDREPTWLSGKNWKPHYEAILVKVVDGIQASQIAEELHIGINTVWRVMKSDYFQQRLNGYKTEISNQIVKSKVKSVVSTNVDSARKVISDAAHEAAITMVGLAQNGGGGKIQFAACKDILDRAGLKPVEIVETRERVYSPEEVIHAKEVLEETQAIVARLTTQTTPYVIRGAKVVASSVTEKGSNGTAPQTEIPDAP